MVSNTLSVDPRIVSPLVCCAGDGLSRFPRDSLNRISYTLDLFSELIGQHDGETLLESENQRFALSLQLSGLAGLVSAISDALIDRKPALSQGEIPVTLDEEDLSKLEILAARRGLSVCAVAQSIIGDHLSGFRLDRGDQND